MTRTPSERLPASATAITGVRQSTWLWVTRSAEVFDEGWWSCHRDTRAGDVALVYRTAPAKDIAYVVRVETDATPVDPDNAVPSTTGYECRYALLDHLPTPIPFGALTRNPALADWPALRVRFVGSTHRVPADVWGHLLDEAGLTQRRLDRLMAARNDEFEYEWQLEERLVAHPEAWHRVGLRLRLDKRQWRFTNGRIADLIYLTRTRRFVVVELKRGPIDQKAVTQIRCYLEQIHRDFPRLRRPLGILVGAQPRPELLRAIRRTRRLRYVDVVELGLTRVDAVEP